MTTAYVYKWTHIPTMKWYVGSRSKKGCHPDDGYICSSKVVKPMIVESIGEWKREIIATGSPEEMLSLETEILKLFDAKNDSMSFNMHNGDGKFSMLNRGGYKRPGVGGVKKGTTPWNKGLTKNDSRVAKYIEKQKQSTRKNNKVRSDKGRKKAIGDNLPWKGIYISPNGTEFLTTIAASEHYDVHRMTIFRWARSGKNGWKFIPKELVATELNVQNNQGEY